MSEPPRRARWLPPLSAADGVLNRTTAATHIRVEADCAEQGCEQGRQGGRPAPLLIESVCDLLGVAHRRPLYG